jgi:hypothetical protein
MLVLMGDAKAKGADLIVYPELGPITERLRIPRRGRRANSQSSPTSGAGDTVSRSI